MTANPHPQTTVIYATPNYKLTRLRFGLILESRVTGHEVYFQPGDDTATMLGNIEAMEEVPTARRGVVFDVMCQDYF